MIDHLKIAMLSPVSWRTPPRHYGPWEQVTSLLTEGLIERGVDVTLFATGDSTTAGKLHSICPRPYSEDLSLEPKVWECLHISEAFEHASEFDIIHNQYDFLPLTYSKLVETPVVCTIHGFSSMGILPVYEKYNDNVYYVSISDADRAPSLDYTETIYHGLPLEAFTPMEKHGNYLLFFGRIHPHKGVTEAMEIAKKTSHKLIIAGIVQDEIYFDKKVKPHIDGTQIKYIGSVGPEKRDEILGNALALLHIINFDEPFGLSVVEAMACGTPVIARNRGSMPELIIDGENGFLIDTLEEAIESIPKISGLNRSNIRKYVEKNFSVDTMVEKYLRLYEKIMINRKIGR
ncbi:MAG: glycosyltransferase family 4 protein [Vulcanimicrobiota bacterium]